MAENRTSQIVALRRAIDCLPVRTREAMLTGIANNTIVVGAYSTDEGICPMLAAHRAGGRTSFIAFARAWDGYCFRGVRRRRQRPRLASATELATLRAHIEASLLAEEQVDLAGALAEHRDLVANARRRERGAPGERRAAVASRVARRERVRPGDPDRSAELGGRHGWRWLRVMRSYDEYEQAMANLDEPASAREPELIHQRG